MSRSPWAVTGHLHIIHSVRLAGAEAILLVASLLASGAAWTQPPAPDSGADVGGHSERTAGPHAEAIAELPADASLDDLIRYAMEHSPELAVAYHRWRAAVERAPQARSLPDPQLGLGVVLDQVDRDAEYMGERYSISQMFPWFGKLGLKGDIATEEAEVESRRYEAARLELTERVTDAWFEYAWLHQAAATARENRDLLLRLESVARAMYRTSTASQADVNRAQVELGRLDDQQRSLEDMLEPTAAMLNATLGRPAHARLPQPPAPSRQRIAGLPERDDAAWLALARQASPELAASRHEVQRERQTVELARKEYYPDFMVGLEYARDGSARMAMMDGGGRDMLVGMVSINIPIRRARYDAGLREARSRLAAADREVDARQISLESELKMALFAYREGQRRLQLYGGTLVPKARQSMVSTEAAYRAGDAGFSDLIDTQRLLLEFQLAHERAAADRARAQARIRTLVGDVNEGTAP